MLEPACFDHEDRSGTRRNIVAVGDKLRRNTMLWTIVIILVVLWALGFGFAGAAVGNLIHILLVIALVVLVVQLITGRRPV